MRPSRISDMCTIAQVAVGINTIYYLFALSYGANPSLQGITTMSLAQIHADTAHGTTSGARAALFIKGLASRIQNECNNQDFAAIRELCVGAAQMADDVALTVEHGADEAERIRDDKRKAGAMTGVATATRVAPSVDTPRVMPPHAGPTDAARAPVPEREGTVEAAPTVGERGQSAPVGDTPMHPGARQAGATQTSTAAPAASKETTATPAGGRSGDEKEGKK